MPYASDAQRKKFHALQAEGKISPKVVAEFDRASKGMKLPDRVAPKKLTGLDRLKSMVKQKQSK